MKKEPAAIHRGPMMHIGPDLQSAQALSDSIQRVLESAAGDVVKIAAIAALKESAQMPSVSVSNCTFTNAGLELT